jgi:hypothetical protein
MNTATSQRGSESWCRSRYWTCGEWKVKKSDYYWRAVWGVEIGAGNHPAERDVCPHAVMEDAAAGHISACPLPPPKFTVPVIGVCPTSTIAAEAGSVELHPGRRPHECPRGAACNSSSAAHRDPLFAGRRDLARAQRHRAAEAERHALEQCKTKKDQAACQI